MLNRYIYLKVKLIKNLTHFHLVCAPINPIVVGDDGSFHVDVCLFTLDLGIALLLPQPPLIHC